MCKCQYNPVEPLADFRDQNLKDDASKNTKNNKLHKSLVLFFHLKTKRIHSSLVPAVLS